ncbi:MAG: cytochrome c [Candidatus Competibacteraceae bacterium]
MNPKSLLLLLPLLLSLPAFADEAVVQLKDGSGKDAVQANCATCHSLDYIVMNSVFLDRKGWEGSVDKMIKVMGAPVKEQDITVIVDYLANNYGK